MPRNVWMPFLKNSTMIMMITAKTTFRKPERRSGTRTSPIYISESRKRSTHSDRMMKRKELMQLPVIDPMPPMTTIRRISYVIADLNIAACTDV